MEQTISYKELQPAFITKNGFNMVLLNEEDYNKMALAYEKDRIIKMLAEDIENHKAGKTKYVDGKEVMDRLKLKYGF